MANSRSIRLSTSETNTAAKKQILTGLPCCHSTSNQARKIWVYIEFSKDQCENCIAILKISNMCDSSWIEKREKNYWNRAKLHTHLWNKRKKICDANDWLQSWRIR
jgi:hypothetical protein